MNPIDRKAWRRAYRETFLNQGHKKTFDACADAMAEELGIPLAEPEPPEKIAVDAGSGLDKSLLQAARHGDLATLLGVKYEVVGYNAVTVGSGESYYYLRRIP